MSILKEVALFGNRDGQYPVSVGFSKEREQDGRQILKRLARFCGIGIPFLDDGPKTRAVVHFGKVGQFMYDDIVDQGHVAVDKSPVEADMPFGGIMCAQ